MVRAEEGEENRWPAVLDDPISIAVPDFSWFVRTPSRSVFLFLGNPLADACPLVPLYSETHENSRARVPYY